MDQDEDEEDEEEEEDEMMGMLVREYYKQQFKDTFYEGQKYLNLKVIGFSKEADTQVILATIKYSF